MASFARSSSTTLGIETDQSECFRCDTQSEEILQRLQARPDLCDVVLIAGGSGKRISAHRLILMASSDYFSALLGEPIGGSEKREITLNEVHGDALEKLVNFCYTGSLELRGDTIKAMLATANHVQLKKVVDGCCEFLRRHLQPSNCLAITFFAEQLNIEILVNNSKRFICENFEEVSNHPEFFLLTAKQLNEFIASDDLSVPSEEFVFHILMKWIEYEPENRRNHFTELLALVRLPLLPPYFLAENVEPLCNTIESQKLVLNALKSHLMLISNSTQPRNYQSKSVENKLLGIQPRNRQSKTVVKHVLAIYLKIIQQNSNIEIAGYNLRTKVWTSWNTPIKLRHDFAVTLMNDNLVVVGGSLGYSTLNTVISLNLRTMIPSKLAPLRTGRKMHSVAILNGSIYAIGGNDGHQDLHSAERWDPASRTWNFVAPMKTARWRSGAAVINDHLYVSGGWSSDGALTSVECYDPVKHIWRSTAPMKVGRYQHCLAAYKGYLFAIGGNRCGKNDAIERYDPGTDTWTTIACLHEINSSTKCASLTPDLFLFNNSKLYMLSSDGNCDNLELQILPTTIDFGFRSLCVDLVAIPFEFSPPESWIRNEKL